MSQLKDINTTIPPGPSGWIYRYPVEVESLSFENVDLFWWQALLLTRWEWAFYGGAIYMVTIFGLQRWMKDRPALELKTPLFLWNLSLGVFSAFGFVRTAPGLLKTLGDPNGFYDSICTRNWLDIPIAFWTIPFILSKPLEFGDTVFTVLRKRPLIFVQWYHHLVTMMVCWILGPMVEPALICCMVLNFGVHSLMYTYFAFRTIGYKFPKMIADTITTAEFSQMIIGLVVNVTSMYYKQIGENCARSDLSLVVFAAVYTSFFILFGKLFYDSVIKSSKSGGKSRRSGGDSGIIIMGGCSEQDEKCVEKTKPKKISGCGFK